MAASDPQLWKSRRRWSILNKVHPTWKRKISSPYCHYKWKVGLPEVPQHLYPMAPVRPGGKGGGSLRATCAGVASTAKTGETWLTLIVDDLLLPLLQLVLQIIFTAVHYYTDLCSYFSYLLFLKHLSTEMQTRHLWLHKSVVKVPSSMQIGLVQFQLFYKLVVTCSVFLVYHWDI